MTVRRKWPVPGEIALAPTATLPTGATEIQSHSGPVTERFYFEPRNVSISGEQSPRV